MDKNMTDFIHPFILSGGSGVRVWPLSRSAYPKQFLKLVGEKSLLQQSCERVNNSLFKPPAILGNHEHRFLIAEQLQEVGITPSHIVLEPVGRNTAPAAATAALIAAREHEEALVLLLPSDHVIDQPEGFMASIENGMEAARKGKIVTFGVRPDSPATGYGYIETLQEEEPAKTVRRFVEKPDKETAQAYLEQGNFYWNAGIFLFSAQSMISAFRTHAPDILACCEAATDQAVTDLDFLRLNKEAYCESPSIALDYAIMEKAENIACVPLNSTWSDLGSWPSVWQHMDKDEEGNSVHGHVVLHDTQNSLVHSDDSACMAVIGLNDIIAVATRDAVLVASKDEAQNVKQVVEELKRTGSGQVNFHKKVHRPWGWYESLSEGPRFQVKCLMVKPGAKLSLQSHHHRAEHWVVVSGTAEVTLGEEVRLMTENESIYIPIGVKHRLGNPGKLPAILVEVQSGAYLGEDDIVRYDDDFDRMGE